MFANVANRGLRRIKQSRGCLDTDPDPVCMGLGIGHPTTLELSISAVPVVAEVDARTAIEPHIRRASLAHGWV